MCLWDNGNYAGGKPKRVQDSSTSDLISTIYIWFEGKIEKQLGETKKLNWILLKNEKNVVI